jgi:DNA-binding IclR family transcriptional regulator
MLACLPDETARAIVECSQPAARTPYTETDPGVILERIDRVRRAGYAVSNQETFVGDISVAAAVRDHKGQMLAAVNIAVPHPRWSPEQAERDLAPVVLETTRAITKALGGA